MHVHLVEKLLASGLGLDGELELGVYRRHAHVHRLRHSEATQVLLWKKNFLLTTTDPETLRLRDCWPLREDTIFLWSVIFPGLMYARQCSKLSTTKALLTSLTNMWLKGRNGGKGWRNLCGQSSGGRRWGRWCTALPLIARPCEPGARNCSAKYSWWWMPYLWISNLQRQKKGFNSASCTELEGRCV